MKIIAWFDQSNGVVSTSKYDPRFTPLGQLLPLFLKEPWIGLTPEERERLWEITPPEYEDRFAFAQAVEDKLKEKNSDLVQA